MATVANSSAFDIEQHPEADAILEGDESTLLWQTGRVGLSVLGCCIGYLDPQKQSDVQRIASIAEMEQVLAVNPPLFLRLPSGQMQLLDGQHRITRAHELGMHEILVAYASPGVFASLVTG